MATNASGGPEQQTDTDVYPAASAPTTVRARFDLVPTHDGIREVVLDEDSGRRTSLGQVPAGATCDARIHTWGANHLMLTCGSGLDVWVFAGTNAIGIRGNHDFLRGGSDFSEELPLPPGTRVELDPTLDDPAPPPSCPGASEQPVDLVLDHVRRPSARPYTVEDVRLRASFGPLDIHLETPSCERTCGGKGDATGHHYEYACTCSGEAHETSMQVHVRDGVVYAIATDGVPHAARSEVEGVWSVPCGARLLYPAGTQIVDRTTDDDLELTPEEARARAVVDAMTQALGELDTHLVSAMRP